MENSSLEPDNLEEVLMELNKLEKRLGESSSADKSQSVITPVLDEYLNSVARTGATHFPWPKIKPLFRAKLESVIDEFHAFSPTDNLPAVPNVDAFSFSACREKVFQQLECFCGVPFTVQRLCELMTAPKRHYKRSDKFMRALEKNMLIVSTVDPKAGTFVQPTRRDSNVSASAREGAGSSSAAGSDVMLNGDHDEDEMRGEPEKKYARLSPASSSSSSSSSMATATSPARKSESPSGSEAMEVDEPAVGGPCDSHDSDSLSAGAEANSSGSRQAGEKDAAPLANAEDDDEDGRRH